MQFKYLGVLFIVFALTGCNGAMKYYEKQQAVDLLKSKQQEITVRVLAEADEWLNSGAIIRAGQQYRIEATGKWQGRFGSDVAETSHSGASPAG